MRIKITELRKRIETLPSENPFDFTDYVERQKEEDVIDLGFFIKQKKMI